MSGKEDKGREKKLGDVWERFKGESETLAARQTTLYRPGANVRTMSRSIRSETDQDRGDDGVVPGAGNRSRICGFERLVFEKSTRAHVLGIGFSAFLLGGGSGFKDDWRMGESFLGERVVRHAWQVSHALILAAISAALVSV